MAYDDSPNGAIEAMPYVATPDRPTSHGT